jgi:epoxyqueuosine reductase
MERQWAALAGLGWLGKNSLLLRKGIGSYFFIASLISDLDLEPDAAVTDHCGTCTACIDACPTQAIVADGVIDARKCISYLTIESKADIPESLADKTEGWAFGCDICQDVCPWNRFAEAHHEPRFLPQENWAEWKPADWLQLNESRFDADFGKSPLTRAGYEKMTRNIKTALKTKE